MALPGPAAFFPLAITMGSFAIRAGKALSFLLIALGFVLPLSMAVSNIVWGMACLLWVGVLLADRGRRNYHWTGLEVPWLALIAVAVIAGLFSENPVHSLKGLKSEILAVIFLLASQIGDRESIKRRLGFFVAGASLAGLAGLIQQIPWGSVLAFDGPGQGGGALLQRILSSHAGRAVGFYSHPITYAEMLMAAGFLALGMAGGRKSWGWAGGAIFLGILASKTRGVWLAVFAALGLWVLVRRDRKILAVTGGLVLATGLMFLARPSLRERAVSIGNTQSDNSNLIRLGLWRRSVEMVREHPLLGVGPGNFLVKPGELRWGGSPPDMDWTETHNMYLQMVVERGLPGLAVFLWFLWSVGRALWRGARSDPAILGIFFGFIGLLCAGMTESWTNDSEVVMVFYFVVGSACALGRCESK